MKIINHRPALFQKTTCNIWTDPYIQHQMLAEHLSTTTDGATRRKESVDKIVDFILSQTKPESRLLDLGCGPGIYTSLLRNKGYSVTGVDFNSASIAHATDQRKDINYILGDYIKDYPPGIYDATIMIYCDIGTHSDTDRDILLTNVYQSLNKGGIFLFDVFTEGIIADKQEGNSWDYAPLGGFWHKEEYLLLSQTFHFPANQAFAYQYNLFTTEGNKHFIVWDRYYSESDITEVLRKTGFTEVNIYKNILNDNNFTSASEMFVVAKK